jgi:uncharacterized protein YjbI with pentapeptide repeats
MEIVHARKMRIYPNNTQKQKINQIGADLTGANLEYANLENASFENANLRNANLDSVNLDTGELNINFKNAGLTGTVFDHCIGKEPDDGERDL